MTKFQKGNYRNGKWPQRPQEVVSVFVLPKEEEIESIRKKIESGFDLEDWEIWIYREFM